MCYCRFMGYGLQIPAYQLGGPKSLWDFRGYGLSNAWVMRVLTVFGYKNCDFLAFIRKENHRVTVKER